MSKTFGLELYFPLVHTVSPYDLEFRLLQEKCLVVKQQMAKQG